MKVLLVDEEPWVLAAVRAVIRKGGDNVTLVAVSDGAAAQHTLDSDTGFDLCLLHAEPEQPGGVDGLIALRREHPEVPVVVLSSTARPSEVVRLVELGAMGCVPRLPTGDQTSLALAMVFSGGVYIPPVVLGLLQGTPVIEGDTVPAVMRPSASEPEPDPLAQPVDATAGAPAWAASTAAGSSDATATPSAAGLRPTLSGLGLTPRQSDVLALLLKGMPNKLIAREMNLSVETVKDHVAAVLRALNVNSRTQAVLVVSQMTLTAPGGGWRLPA
jgi:DNA-binding NarL/FixJ family response regulator